MKRVALTFAALTFASTAIAQTTGTSTPPSPETQGTQGAESVQKNLGANKSDGNATKGLTNAEQHITDTHGKAHSHHGKDKGATKRNEHSEKVERAEKPEHSEKPEQPERPERPGH